MRRAAARPRARVGPAPKYEPATIPARVVGRTRSGAGDDARLRARRRLSRDGQRSHAFHANAFALLLASLAADLPDPALAVGAAMLVAGVVHTSFDVVPALALGVLNASMAASTLPRHRLMLAGRGREALRLSALGSFAGALAAIPLAIPLTQLAADLAPALDRQSRSSSPASLPISSRRSVGAGRRRRRRDVRAEHRARRRRPRPPAVCAAPGRERPRAAVRWTVRRAGAPRRRARVGRRVTPAGLRCRCPGP